MPKVVEADALRHRVRDRQYLGRRQRLNGAVKAGFARTGDMDR